MSLAGLYEVARAELVTPDEVKHPAFNQGAQGFDCVIGQRPAPGLVGVQEPDCGVSPAGGQLRREPAGGDRESDVEQCVDWVNGIAGRFASPVGIGGRGRRSCPGR